MRLLLAAFLSLFPATGLRPGPTDRPDSKPQPGVPKARRRHARERGNPENHIAKHACSWQPDLSISTTIVISCCLIRSITGPIAPCTCLAIWPESMKYLL